MLVDGARSVKMEIPMVAVCRVYLVYLVCLVYSVCLDFPVHLVSSSKLTRQTE